jgi:hypothetical protein
LRRIRRGLKVGPIGAQPSIDLPIPRSTPRNLRLLATQLRGNVVDDRVAGGVAHRPALLDVAGRAAADDDGKLDLPVVHPVDLEKSDRGAGTAERIAGALDQRVGRLERIARDFAGMAGAIGPNADQPLDRRKPGNGGNRFDRAGISSPDVLREGVDDAPEAVTASKELRRTTSLPMTTTATSQSLSNTAPIESVSKGRTPAARFPKHLL